MSHCQLVIVTPVVGARGEGTHIANRFFREIITKEANENGHKGENNTINILMQTNKGDKITGNWAQAFSFRKGKLSWISLCSSQPKKSFTKQNEDESEFVYNSF